MLNSWLMIRNQDSQRVILLILQQHSELKLHKQKNRVGPFHVKQHKKRVKAGFCTYRDYPQSIPAMSAYLLIRIGNRRISWGMS